MSMSGVLCELLSGDPCDLASCNLTITATLLPLALGSHTRLLYRTSKLASEHLTYSVQDHILMSLPSTAHINVLPPGPQIVSFQAGTSSHILPSQATYGNGCLVEITFDTATSQPDISDQDKIAQIFAFSTAFAQYMSGLWVDGTHVCANSK